MRIITGKYKGRHFDIPRSFKARPTTDFAKENIFNVLIQHVDFDGADALDLFAGTGSITLELLSRGCGHVTCVEQDRYHHRFITECLAKLAVPADVCRCIRGDVFRFVRGVHTQFDFIFADPPYALKELPTLPDLVIGGHLLKPDGIFVLEHGKDYSFNQHPLFMEHRSYGSVNFSLFKNHLT